jgi:anti-sigma factor RsiW
VHLFVQPVGDAHRASAHSAAHAGYHVITWRDAAFQFVAVSDLNAAELREFAEGFARQPG